MTLDSRKFSQETYKALIALKEGDRDSKRDTKLEPKHCQKSIAAPSTEKVDRPTPANS